MKFEIFLFYMCFKFVHGAHILSSRFQLDDDTDLSSVEKDLPVCDTADELIPHMQCFLYYTCENSEPKLTICHQPLYFNTKTGKCDEEYNVPDCVEGIRVLPGQKQLPFLTNLHPFMTTTTTSMTTPSTTPTITEQSTTTTTTTPSSPPPPKSRKTSVATERTTLESPTKTIRKILQGGKQQQHKYNENSSKEVDTPQTTTTASTTMPTSTTTTTTPKVFTDWPVIPSYFEDTTPQRMMTTQQSIFMMPSTGRGTTRTTTATATRIFERGCQPVKIIIHHYPGPCTAEFTCSDGSSFLIEHCTSHLLWKPKL